MRCCEPYGAAGPERPPVHVGAGLQPDGDKDAGLCLPGFGKGITLTPAATVSNKRFYGLNEISIWRRGDSNGALAFAITRGLNKRVNCSRAAPII